MTRQLRLDLNRTPAYRREDFVVSQANVSAVGVLEGWRSWPGRVAALIGPEGSGKTHLARAWASEARAAVLVAPPSDFALLQGRPVLIEEAEAFDDHEALFHLINMAASDGALLLTSRLSPRQWPAALPDLRSRLDGLQLIELSLPDDEALGGMLRNLLAERNIVPSDDLIPYLLPRIERSFAAARDVVNALDEAAAAKRREVNRALAAQVLGIDNVINHLLG